MALARLISRGQSGLDAYEVSVEVHIGGGLPSFTIAGLPAPAVRESRARVRAALQQCGIKFPASRITAHLGPADIPKQGGRFDLAIALGIVQATLNKQWALGDIEFIGELSLGGELRSVTGVVPAAIATGAAGRQLVVPSANAAEASLVPGVPVRAAEHLLEVIDMLDGHGRLGQVRSARLSDSLAHQPDLDEVRGQSAAKRALTVAAAGNHNLLMIGPPGSGKSMLAARLACLLPVLSDDELLSVASIASVAGETTVLERGRVRPYRSPHHTTRAAALVGGGVYPKPGEISLAHLGILFLDELPEFSREALEALREPLESGRVQISRLGRRVDFPARFQLVAAMNPCPCGYLGDGTDRCRCGAARIERYRGRVSGPLLDRFDLHIEVPQIDFRELSAVATVPRSAELARDVAEARRRQLDRGRLNAELGQQELLSVAALDDATRRLLADAQARWHFSTRGVIRILRLARTLADLAGRDQPASADVAEALQLRRLDRPLSVDTV